MLKNTTWFLLTALIISALPSTNVSAQVVANRAIVFPVLGGGPNNYTDTFAAPRSGGRTHEGIDIFGKKMQPLIAAVDGTISFVPYPEPSYGYAVTIRDSENWSYHYIHLNNDSPGTDDGKGDGINAYAPDMASGNRVVKGQLIGFLGDSGNAETTPPHLHFEIRDPSGAPINPFESLKTAQFMSNPVIHPELPQEVLPYGNTFTGGANLAVGNFKADNAVEFATAPRTKGGPHVKIHAQDKTILAQFMAYDTRFIGGVDLAAGDVDGDGIDEIITAPGPTGGPHVRIFKSDGTPVGGFMAYDSQFRGGIRVAAADMDGDKKAEIITAPTSLGGPHVKIFKADGTVSSEFMAYSAAFRGGVDVAAASVTSTSPARIVTAPGPGGGPHVRIFSSAGIEAASFMAYDPGFRGGVRIAAGNVRISTPEAEILAIPLSNGGSHLKMYALNGELINEKFAFEPWWLDGYDIAASNNLYYISSGPGYLSHIRRTTVRKQDF
jgi:hypothetical protein